MTTDHLSSYPSSSR